MPADFQDRMLKYSKYGISIRTTEAEGKEYYLVGVTFKPTWKVVTPENSDKVYCVPATDGEGMFYYFGEVETGIGYIFDCIDETIHYNEDVEKKIVLLREKVRELQELFANETYETLSTLKFVTEQPETKKSKRGRPPKKQAEQNKTEEKETMIEETKEEEVVQGQNVEEASEIDKKIAAALKGK